MLRERAPVAPIHRAKHLDVADRADDSAAAVALAWTIRGGHVIAIPKSGSVAHVKENAVALSLTLTQQKLQTLDAAHPPQPSR
jgi:diketogulonate reductase-like aldo/keto reductase